MTQWIAEHPYLTFLLIALLLAGFAIAIGHLQRDHARRDDWHDDRD